ncbi:efflux RND transporter periplasmic adaptor subunit [Pendulispora brunnea]|uniref:Efflux RND transporter periplasmic adaptor subunit n=1 Tax=Pendulispora brunnea TaxID=2905690 RepID=A0ABZ2K504_9BACT
MRARIYFGLFFMGTLAAAASIAGCQGAPREAVAAERNQPPLVAVRLTPVQRGPVSRPVRGAGVVKLKNEADLSFKVGGVVTAVLVEEGARVRRGQVLARIDPTETEAALRQAQEASARAERDVERARKLVASNAVPVIELQNAETAAASSKAAVDAAAFNAQRTVIVAPDDGRVEKRTVDPGEIAAPGVPVFHVSGRSRGAVVRVGLTDRDVLRVTLGDEARVMLDLFPDAPVTGKVTQIAASASPATGTFDVEVAVDPTAKILSGMTAKVEIAHVERDLATVPIAALTDGRGDAASVFVVDDKVARRVPVKVAFLSQDRAALLTRLEGHERVVEAGAADLDDGTAVHVLP